MMDGKRWKSGRYDPYVMISQVITKDSLEEFTQEELFPVETILYTDPQKCGGYGPVTIVMKNGNRKVVDYEGIEGRMML